MSSKEIDRRQELIDRFVSAFRKLDDMLAFEREDIKSKFVQGEPDQHGFRYWQPKKVSTDPSALEPIYAKIPARFPPVFEQLVLSYRWAEIDLVDYRLVPNPVRPGPERTI